MEATPSFHIYPLNYSPVHCHNTGFRGPCWTDFHLALCVRESHLALGVGAEGRKPCWPNHERQPSSVTRSHSQTSFMCKSSLELLFTCCALKYMLHQVKSVTAELHIDFILCKGYLMYLRTHICSKVEKQLYTATWATSNYSFSLLLLCCKFALLIYGPLCALSDLLQLLHYWWWGLGEKLLVICTIAGLTLSRFMYQGGKLQKISYEKEIEEALQWIQSWNLKGLKRTKINEHMAKLNVLHERTKCEGRGLCSLDGPLHLSRCCRIPTIMADLHSNTPQ